MFEDGEKRPVSSEPKDGKEVIHPEAWEGGKMPGPEACGALQESVQGLLFLHCESSREKSRSGSSSSASVAE